MVVRPLPSIHLSDTEPNPPRAATSATIPEPSLIASAFFPEISPSFLRTNAPNRTSIDFPESFAVTQFTLAFS